MAVWPVRAAPDFFSFIFLFRSRREGASSFLPCCVPLTHDQGFLHDGVRRTLTQCSLAEDSPVQRFRRKTVLLSEALHLVPFCDASQACFLFILLFKECEFFGFGELSPIFFNGIPFL